MSYDPALMRKRQVGAIIGDDRLFGGLSWSKDGKLFACHARQNGVSLLCAFEANGRSILRAPLPADVRPTPHTMPVWSASAKHIGIVVDATREGGGSRFAMRWNIAERRWELAEPTAVQFGWHWKWIPVDDAIPEPVYAKLREAASDTMFSTELDGKYLVLSWESQTDMGPRWRWERKEVDRLDDNRWSPLEATYGDDHPLEAVFQLSKNRKTIVYCTNAIELRGQVNVTLHDTMTNLPQIPAFCEKSRSVYLFGGLQLYVHSFPEYRVISGSPTPIRSAARK